MSLLGFGRSTDTERDGYEAVRVDEDLAAALAAPVEREAVAVRPEQDNSGIEAMSNVLESLHSVETESGLLGRNEQNVSPAHSAELRYARDRAGGERVATLQYLAGDDRLDGTLERQLRNQYPESTLERRSAALFPAGDLEGQHLAAAELELRRYHLYPLKSIDLPGFTTDPTGNILEEMVGEPDAPTDASVVCQIQFKPARRGWTDGVEAGHGRLDGEDTNVQGEPSLRTLAMNLREPTYEKEWRLFRRETVEYPPSKVDKRVADLLEQQQGEKGWHLRVAVIAVAEDPETAVERVSHTASMYRNFYENNAEQTLVPRPLTGEDARETALDVARRRWEETGIVKAQREVAGLTNVPRAEYVSTNKFRWSMSNPGEGVPPGTPRADWSALDVDPGDATKEEQEVALLDGPDEATGGEGVTWYGLGTRHGVEAGIDYAAVTNPHKFVHGESGTGKTTYLAVDAGQQFDRAGGGLRLDPTGDDVEDVLAEWPDDRDPEDLIYMDLSGDHDRIPRFNFLEVPEYLSPEDGDRQFNEFVEALSEDLVAMIGEAGGTDNYVGARMKRVLKAVIRAMTRVGEDPTLLDVAMVCSSAENLGKFAEAMPDDRYQYLRDRIETHAERDDSELDPLAGRLDEWVLNPNVRELICARDPTFSVQDAVEQGKEIVVRFSDSGSDTVKHMVGNALITRSYFAQRFHRPDAPFELVVDEAQSVITAASDIENILDQGRKYGYRATIACQRPATQLDKDVRAAVLGNAKTTISFSSGREEEAKAIAGQHDGVESGDLTNFAPYRFYMSTVTEDGESTHSYKVDAFRAPREARQMAAEAVGEDADGRATELTERVESLKERSLARYGVTRAEVDETGSPFDVEDTAAPGTLGDSEAVALAAAQGVYAAACRHGAPTRPVPLAECAAGVRRRVARLEETPDDVAETLADPDDVFKRVLQDADGVSMTADGPRVEDPQAALANVGTDESAGGWDHARVLLDALPLLARAGIDGTVRQASGTDPDAVGRPAPEAEQEHPAVVEALTGGGEARIEVASSTTSKVGSEVKHALQAANEGRRCVTLVRPDRAQRVAQALLGDPALYREHVEADGTRYRRAYTLNDYTVGGVAPTRPGATRNVWLQDESTGEVVLRDTDSTEHARFEGAGAVFSDLDPYPQGGENTVTEPVLPEYHLDAGAEPDVSVVAVPEGAESLGDLELIVDGDGTRVPLDVVGAAEERYPTDSDESATSGVTPTDDDLDVTDGALALLDLLRDHGEPVTKQAASDLDDERDDGPGVARSTIARYVNNLTDEGALQVVGTTETDATLYRPA